MPLDTAAFIHTWLLPFLAVVLAGCGVLVTAKLTGWMNVHAAWLTADQQAKVLSLEKDAYNQAVNWLLNMAQTQGEKVKIQPDSWMMKTAVQMVLDHPASVLGKPEDVANKIVALLPASAISTDTTNQTIKTTTVTVETMPPIQEKQP